MPDLRALLVAVGVGAGVAGYTLLWWHWPLAVGAGAGILLGGLALTGAVSVRPDGPTADAAWLAAAPDLQDPPAEPVDGPPGTRDDDRVTPEPTAEPQPRALDRPSGD